MKKSLHIIFPKSQPFNLPCHLTVDSLSILTLKRFCFSWTQTQVYPEVILLITFSSGAFTPSPLQFWLHCSWIGRNYEGIYKLTFNLKCVHYCQLSSFCSPVFFLFEWSCFPSEVTKITETFMKQFSCTLSQLFRNYEYLTEKPLSLLLAQRSWLKQAVCPTRELAFFQLEEKNILESKGGIHWNVFSLCPGCFSLMWFHSFYLHETP